jgi:hypothetical protein
MIEIYRTSLRYFFTSLPALLVFSGVMEGFLWAVQPKNATTITLVPLILMAFLFHRHFLFGEELTLRRLGANAGKPVPKWGWFLLASVGLMALPMAPGLVVAISMAGVQFGGADVVVIMILIMLPAIWSCSACSERFCRRLSPATPATDWRPACEPSFRRWVI